MAVLVRWNTTTVKATDYTAALGDTVRANPTGGGINITAPSPVLAINSGRQFKVKNVSSSTNAITLLSTDGSTFDGASSGSFTMTTALQSVTFEYDGVSNWMVV